MVTNQIFRNATAFYISFSGQKINKQEFLTVVVAEKFVTTEVDHWMKVSKVAMEKFSKIVEID